MLGSGCGEEDALCPNCQNWKRNSTECPTSGGATPRTSGGSYLIGSINVTMAIPGGSSAAVVGHRCLCRGPNSPPAPFLATTSTFGVSRLENRPKRSANCLRTAEGSNRKRPISASFTSLTTARFAGAVDHGRTVTVDKQIHPECPLCRWAICPECEACRDMKYGGCPQNAG